MKSLHDYGLNGYAPLEDLIRASSYKSVEQAVASLTILSHPDTVRQTKCKPLFKTIRNASRRRQLLEQDGRTLAYDDNKSPTDAFLWCNGLSKKLKDVQFNHVYLNSQDPDQYTCLANLCITPAFLAKLTDTHEHVRMLLRYRVSELYEWVPTGQLSPTKPEGYAELAWAPTLPAVSDVPGTMRAIMDRKPRDSTVLIARQIGWLFGEPQQGKLEAAPVTSSASSL
ncbi:MAG: hypothetical protein NVSMB62_25260 [Acidobacteriaceae bacterium]